MKYVMMLVLLVGLLFTQTGCIFGTPAYSGRERYAQIKRNVRYERQQIADDWDHFWLLRPTGHLTIWNLY
jgi:hypothetical protein